MFRDKSIVPVLMFHSIGDANPNWVWSYLTESPESFENVISKIAGSGFKTVGLQDLFQGSAPI